MACWKSEKGDVDCPYHMLKINRWLLTEEEKAVLPLLCSKIPRGGCLFCVEYDWVREQLRRIMQQNSLKKEEECRCGR